MSESKFCVNFWYVKFLDISIKWYFYRLGYFYYLLNKQILRLLGFVYKDSWKMFVQHIWLPAHLVDAVVKRYYVIKWYFQQFFSGSNLLMWQEFYFILFYVTWQEFYSLFDSLNIADLELRMSQDRSFGRLVILYTKVPIRGI